jgi:hypothetical protein
LVGAVLFGLIVSKTDVATMRASLAAVDVPLYLLFVVAFGVVNLLCDAFAATMAFRLTVAPVRFKTIALVRAASYLPQIVNFHVGQAYTAYLLTRVYGAPARRVAGAMLFVYATTMGALVAVPVLWLPVSWRALPWLSRTVAGVLACGLAYLAVLAARPRALAKWPAVSVLFEAGVKGHLVVLFCRLPHVAVLCAGTWLSFHFFHITIPPFESLTYLPAILLVVTLPITPQGVGAREVIALELLARFVPASAGDPKGPIVASGVAWVVGTTVVAALIGLVFTPAASRLWAAGPAGDGDGPVGSAPSR